MRAEKKKRTFGGEIWNEAEFLRYSGIYLWKALKITEGGQTGRV